MEAPFGMALRPTKGFAESLLQQVGCLEWAEPDIGTPRRRQGDLGALHPLPWVEGPLHLRTDGTGIKVSAKASGTQKHGGSKRRAWTPPRD